MTMFVNNMLTSPEQLDRYTAEFRAIFRRADQALHFRTYLRGLLEPIERKNVEAIAATAAGNVDSDLAQALQHFISHSPWDCRDLFAVLWKQSAELRRDPGTVWAVHDVAFPKKGQSSVGVYRQFARSVGKKINCQLAVFVSQVGPGGFFPLAARLYLPTNWLKEHGPAAERTIPAEYRQPASKAAIALALLEELHAGGEPVGGVIAEPGFLNAEEFTEGVAARGWPAPAESPEGLAEVFRRVDWMKAQLGLDHFEGRTWQGWHHHVSVVFAAYHLLAAERGAGAPFREGQ